MMLKARPAMPMYTASIGFTLVSGLCGGACVCVCACVRARVCGRGCVGVWVFVLVVLVVLGGHSVRDECVVVMSVSVCVLVCGCVVVCA